MSPYVNEEEKTKIDFDICTICNKNKKPVILGCCRTCQKEIARLFLGDDDK